MAAVKRIDLDMKELQGHLDRVRAALGEDGYGKLTAALETLAYLTDVVGDKDTSIHKLRKMLFGASTEKTRKVLREENRGTTSPPAADNKDGGAAGTPPGAGGKESSEEKANGSSGFSRAWGSRCRPRRSGRWWRRRRKRSNRYGRR